jgi:adenosylhomocysteine nucleosidase
MKLVLSAMPEELEQLLPGLSNPVLDHGAGREFHRGKIGAETVVLAFSRWGKVAAAATVAHAVTRYQPDAVLFTGIAGALVDHLAIGDYVLADALVQHDLDASPFFAATEVPLLGHRRLPVDSKLLQGLEAAVLNELAESSSLPAPRLHRGTIATGDQVIGDSAARERVKLRVPEALCVEMEGAAVAQVCLEFGVPFACLRMISDHADERIGAGDVFAMARASGVLTRGALQRWLAAD